MCAHVTSAAPAHLILSSPPVTRSLLFVLSRVVQIKGVAFSSYSQSEIRKLSVKSVKNPTAFDTLGHPVDGGSSSPCRPPFPFRLGHVASSKPIELL